MKATERTKELLANDPPFLYSFSLQLYAKSLLQKIKTATKKRCSYQTYPPFADNFYPGFLVSFPASSPSSIIKNLYKKEDKTMAKNLSQTTKDRISAGQKDSWEDPTKRVDQKKRIEAKKLLKDAVPDRIESPSPLNIEAARQALIDEIKKLDDQLEKFESLVKRRDKLSSILGELNSLREGNRHE